MHCASAILAIVVQPIYVNINTLVVSQVLNGVKYKLEPAFSLVNR